jgi:hypothetical protein
MRKMMSLATELSNPLLETILNLHPSKIHSFTSLNKLNHKKVLKIRSLKRFKSLYPTETLDAILSSNNVGRVCGEFRVNRYYAYAIRSSFNAFKEILEKTPKISVSSNATRNSEIVYSNNSESSIKNYAHKFLVREGFEVQLILPLNFTKEESLRLAHFIESIPF